MFTRLSNVCAYDIYRIIGERRVIVNLRKYSMSAIGVLAFPGARNNNFTINTGAFGGGSKRNNLRIRPKTYMTSLVGTGTITTTTRRQGASICT